MKVLRRIPRRPVRWKEPAAAIGIFDGVHRGHQVILRRAVTRAKALKSIPIVVTFHPHPLMVLNPPLAPPLLLSLKQRLEAFKRCGIRGAVVVPFTRAFSRWTPEQFVRRLLVGALRAREVVVGHDFGFGVGRSGRAATLQRLGRRFGFKVHVIGPVKIAGERIASNRIRQKIRAGCLDKAARFLGRPVTVVGVCVPGSGRGRKLGFPTANLRLEAGVPPPVGVYAVSARVGNRRIPGMANLGFRPTFGDAPKRDTPLLSVRARVSPCGTSPLLEVHLFGMRRALYGRRLEVAFHRRLRPERRFPSAEALEAQMESDARRARRFFALQSKRRVV